MSVKPVKSTFSYDDKKGEEWRLNGLLHNENGPARTYSNGTKQYYKHGYLHRTDGPAVEAHHEHFIKYVYYVDGMMHNENGPAYIERGNYSVLLKHFYMDKLHNLQGPAILINYLYKTKRTQDSKNYYIHGNYYTRDNYYKVIKTAKIFIQKLKEKRRKSIAHVIHNSTTNCLDICKIISFYCL